MKRLLALFLAFAFIVDVKAATSLNVVGSDESVAISSYDVVAFFTQKKAILGSSEYAVRHLDATWLFATAENMAAFQAAPAKFMPEWGGHCAACIADGCISSKKLSGDFEFIDNKLYLFSFGNRSRSSAKDGFVYGRTSKSMLIRYGDKNWTEMKSRLENGLLQQVDAKTYQKTPHEK